MLQRDIKGLDGVRDDDDDELTLEEKIEEERAALESANLTPVTLATF